MTAVLDKNGIWSTCCVTSSMIGASAGAGLSSTRSCAVVHAWRKSMHVTVHVRHLGPHLGRVEREGAVRVQAALLGGDALGRAAGAEGGVVDACCERHISHTVALRIQPPLPKHDIPAAAQLPYPPSLWTEMRVMLTPRGTAHACTRS